MDLTEAMQFPFRREGGFTRILIGGVLLLIPIIGWLFILGYFTEVIRRVAEKHPDPMPNWDDFGAKLKDGALSGSLFLIWWLMAFIITLPLMLVDESGILAGVLAAVILYFFMPVFLGRYAVTSKFVAGLHIPEIIGMIRRNFGSYLGSWLLAGIMQLVALVILWLIGAITCGIGIIFTQFFWNLFQTHLLGQLYRILVQDGGMLEGNSSV
jgi:hypothetical protein